MFRLANFDNYFLPGGGDFDNFLKKCQNPHPMLNPPPSGLTLIGALDFYPPPLTTPGSPRMQAGQLEPLSWRERNVWERGRSTTVLAIIGTFISCDLGPVYNKEGGLP